MTQIDFYTNVADKLVTACRVVAKGYARGARIVVLCPDPATAQRIDRMLWTTPPTGFIPHCAASDPLAAETPVLLDHQGGEPLHDQVLVNLRAAWPPHFGRFERLIEIVTLEDQDRREARERYKFYRDRGYAIRTHDLGESAKAGA